MRSSEEALFTRHNPFPPDPPLPKSHYSPSRSKKIPKQHKRLAIGPVRFSQPPNPPEPSTKPSSLRSEDQCLHDRSHSVRLFPPPHTEHQINFSESWPSTDLSFSTASTAASHHPDIRTQIMRNMVATATTVAQEPSVLAKYIERFRFGKPQSREERQRHAIDEGDDQSFWWMSTSPPSSSTPTQASEKHTRGPLRTHSNILEPLHDGSSLSSARDALDLSMLTLSEMSHCEPEESEFLQLQERASRLLQKSEHSLSTDSVPISSEGVGRSDFSSPPSADEPVRRPLMPSLMSTTNILDLDLCERTSIPAPPAVGSVGSGVRREDDILFQWRLRRKMEQARQWCQEAPSHNSVLNIPLTQTQEPNQKPHHSTFNSKPLQRPNLSFTPITCASLELPVPESALPVSSPSVSKLRPDGSIQTQDQPDLHQRSREDDAKNLKATSALPQLQVQNVTQVSLPEAVAEHSSRQRPSSSYESTEDCERAPHKKKSTAVKAKTENEGCEKKIAPSSRKKKSNRHSVEPHGSPTKARRARGHEGVSPKAEEPSRKSKWEEKGQRSTRGAQSGDRALPSSPIHNALGQVVSEVLFPGADSPTQCKTPRSLDSPAHTPPPPSQSPLAPPNGVQQPFEVIDHLMQEAEDSDGQEFEDDPLLQVLRQQRKWLKEQLCDVDVKLQQLCGT